MRCPDWKLFAARRFLAHSGLNRYPFILRTRISDSLHNVGCEIVRQRAGAAVNFEPVAFRQGINSAELQHAFRAILKTALNREQIGNDHTVAFSNRTNDFTAREDAGDVTEPTLQNFDVNSQRERVESANLNLLPPMRRSVGIQVIAGETLQPHMMRTSDVIFSQNLFDQQIGAHSKWWRAKHRHQFGITF